MGLNKQVHTLQRGRYGTYIRLLLARYLTTKNIGKVLAKEVFKNTNPYSRKPFYRRAKSLHPKTCTGFESALIRLKYNEGLHWYGIKLLGTNTVLVPTLPLFTKGAGWESGMKREPKNI